MILSVLNKPLLLISSSSALSLLTRFSFILLLSFAAKVKDCQHRSGRRAITKNFKESVTFTKNQRHIIQHLNVMKRNLLTRLMIMSFIALCGTAWVQVKINKQSAEDQHGEEITVTSEKRVSGEFMILESISRYITAAY